MERKRKNATGRNGVRREHASNLHGDKIMKVELSKGQYPAGLAKSSGSE